MTSPIVGRSIIGATKEQVACDLAGEAVILNLKDGTYYGLNSVGARIWHLIQEPKTVDEIRDAVLKEYDVEPDRCERDLMALLQELAAKELIEIRDEAPA